MIIVINWSVITTLVCGTILLKMRCLFYQKVKQKDIYVTVFS